VSAGDQPSREGLAQDLHFVGVLGPRALAPRQDHALFAADLQDPALAREADVADDQARDRVSVADWERLAKRFGSARLHASVRGMSGRIIAFDSPNSAFIPPSWTSTPSSRTSTRSSRTSTRSSRISTRSSRVSTLSSPSVFAATPSITRLISARNRSATTLKCRLISAAVSEFITSLLSRA